MKKILSLLAVVLTGSVMMAQGWVKPTLVAPEFTALADDGETEQYLYNVKAGGFLAGANDYQTRASVVDTLGHSFKVTNNGDGHWTLYNYVLKFNEYRKMFTENPQSIWVDNNNGANADAWVIEVAADNTFTITNDGVALTGAESSLHLGVAPLYDGVEGNTRLWLYDNGLFGADGETCVFGAAEDFQDVWAAVSVEEYAKFREQVAEYKAQIDIYNAAIALGKRINAAKEDYEGIDLAAIEAVYDNTESTLEQIAAADEALSAAIVAYVNAEMGKATVANPVDATGRLVNPSFETGDLTGWTYSKTNANGLGDSSDGNVQPNSNPTYTCSEADGEYLFNTWAWGNPITQIVEDLPNGIYEVGAMVASSDDCTNVFITADGGVGELHHAITLAEDETLEKNKKQAFGTRGSFLVPVTNGTITIGAVGADADGISYKKGGQWWYKVDDFRLSYLGNSDEAWMYFRENSDLDFEPVDEETFAMKQLVGDYNKAVSDFAAATSAEVISYALEGMIVLNDSLKANIAAYEAYAAQVNASSDEIAELSSKGGSGDYIDAIEAYLGDNIEPGTEAGLDDIVFTNGSYGYIADNRQLKTEEIVAETEFLKLFTATTISKSAVEGSDFTGVLVNPDFTAAWSGGLNPPTGWAFKTKPTNFNGRGGLSGLPVAESWHSYFDMYQTVTQEVPEGLYAISMNGFCRLDDGDTDIAAEVYMNDFSTPFSSILDGAIPEEEAQDGINSYLVAGSYTNNPNEAIAKSTVLVGNELDTQDENGVRPNGRVGASIAFSADRYKATAYGLVEAGQPMTLGVRNLNSTHQWVLWTNFKLTFMGKNEEAVNSVLESILEGANKFKEELTITLPAEVEDALDGAIDNADAAEDVDAKYDALIALNKAYKEARNIVALYHEVENAATNIYNAIADAENEGVDSDELEEYSLAADEAMETLETGDMSVEDMQKFVDDAKVMIEEINFKSAMVFFADEDLAAEMAEATPENPVDVTGAIKNADFAEGATVKWQNTKNGGNGPALAGGIEGPSAEFWNGTAANLQFNLWQNVALPAGTYRLTVTAANSLNGQATNNEEGQAFLYAGLINANDTTMFVAEEGVEVSEQGCLEYNKQYSVEFYVPEAQWAMVGIKSVGTMSARWFVCDNFTLEYLGAEAPDAVDAVAAKVPAAPVAIFDLTGRQVAKAAKGVYIINGKKVLK